jgi:sulfhydrogenase subunit beta (sulfur reductase)
VQAAAGQMGRLMQTGGLRELMADSRQAARWDDVAARCLTCGNRTMACPTCFCTAIEDTTDLTRDHAERWERWDSCFDLHLDVWVCRWSLGARRRGRAGGPVCR